ncbi:hypothetical protein LSH36_13g04032 [Paralvinella palmiformis]|uniref:DNA ligase 4 n=1 Tax=Paralvinella palmiformis TaxID=53620 RepID=A0AAD9NHX0_9ANNE|nr:hypothetical protein LSH36_13g04032 [Paralvinella palmiformis]
MATVASGVPFHNFCLMLEKIKKLPGTDAKKKILKEFIDEWRSCHNRIHKDDMKTTEDSFFPAMRLLLPQLEKEREAYGIKEHMLARLYIEILGLGKESPSAKKLLNYRAPKSSRNDAGDFAGVAFWILKPRCPEKGTLTLEDINSSLDKMARCNAAKDKEGVRKAMRYMIQKTSAEEQKWLIRMILKEMKMGLSQQSVFSIFHQDAEDVYNVKMSLEKVCTMLRDPSIRLHEIEISIFSPFRPMLGDRGNPNKVEELFNKNYSILRQSLMERGSSFTNKVTHTSTFPGVNTVILDGEIVAYDPETNTIGYKGQNMDMKSIHNDGFQPMICVFDVLLLNDKVLSNKPLHERKAFLQNDVFTPIEGRIVLSEFKEARTKQDCVDALNEAIERHDEGLMVKDPLSPYKPNTRKGGWYKMKPEYIGGLMDELDVIVVGGFMGVGHRSQMMSHFLCALAVPLEDGGKPNEFHSFCKVGSGYTRKELYDFNKLLLPHWQAFNKKNPPPWLKLASGFKQKPDAIIEPSKSKILQIKAAEITASDQYKTGYTLRFPRVEKIRDDKMWYECMTITEVEQLQQKCSGKLTGRLMEANEEEPVKKRQRITSRHVRPTVMAQFRGIDVTNVTKISEIFSGKEFCVINGTSTQSKSDLEKKIVEFGGSIIQNPRDSTFCVLANKISIKVKNIISKDVYDVVNINWLLHCVETKSCLLWKPNELIHISPKSEKKLAKMFDCHGDGYYDDTNVDDLKKVFNKIDEKSVVPLNVEDLAELEMEYFPQDYIYGLFRLCRVYLDVNLVLGDPSTHINASSLELVRLYLRFYGATVLDKIDHDVSHVVVDSSDCSHAAELNELNRRRVKKFQIVSEKWVRDSIIAEKLLGEKGYGI